MKRIWDKKHNVNSLDSDFVKYLFRGVICVYLEYFGSFFVIRGWATIKPLGYVQVWISTLFGLEKQNEFFTKVKVGEVMLK